jgi:hypothetical protein
LAVDFGASARNAHGFWMARNTGMFFDKQRGNAEFSKQEGRHQPAGACADDNHFCFFLIHNVFHNYSGNTHQEHFAIKNPAIIRQRENPSSSE